MDITIHPGKLQGSIHVIPSKSQAHRLLICAAFADNSTELVCPEISRDIEATADCLNQMCGNITRTEYGFHISPYVSIRNQTPYLNCGESGSTLRFLLPISGALGLHATFHAEGRLPNRPLSPLWEEMERMGCNLSWVSENELQVQGKLRSGDYHIDGGVSSQFITGLLFAASLMDGDSTIHITGKAESQPYITMTQKAMSLFGIHTENYQIHGGQSYHSPGTITVEGDWSNAAFWLTAKELGNPITLTNLDPGSPQGDRAVAQLLSALSENQTIDAADIPDLVPILSVAAAARKGATFQNIRRLRLKESDRVASVVAMMEALGASTKETESTLTIDPAPFRGCTIDAANDHRIAMAAAIAATIAQGPVTILGADCVKKSYPRFWDEYDRLGGKYELHIR